MSDPQNPMLKLLLENERRLKQTQTREMTPISTALLRPYTIGDLLYASSTSALAKLADVAVNQVLKSGGVGAPPAYGQIVLTTDASDYTTSAWTPTYLGNTTAGVTTYTAQVGKYIRVGNLVVASGEVVWTAATGTGNANISLPFTAQNVANQFISGSVRVDSVTFVNGTPQLIIAPNTAFFNLVTPITNAASPAIAVEAAGNIVFTVAFFV